MRPRLRDRLDGGCTLGLAGLPSTLRVNDREYCWPQRPLVVVCLDGSSFDYIREANAGGATPYLRSLVSSGHIRMVDAAMPTFTNPNNLSIVTGVSPARHGICGNFFLDPATGQAIMMNDPSFLRAVTIPGAFSRAGARVVIITAKDKLRKLLSAGLDGPCVSAEQEGQPVYSALLSEHVLKRGVEIMRSIRPDIIYLSTSDYVQHTCPPGSSEATRFYAVIDRHLEELDHLGATLVVTADHGMCGKTDREGRPNILFLQDLLDTWFGVGSATVILPITDPYVGQHGSLGSFATVYVEARINRSEVLHRLRSLSGIELVLERDAACRLLELPEDRVGGIVVCAEREFVVGTRPEEHDLSQLRGPLRSHGGLAEREVPMLSNRLIRPAENGRRLRNYDAFWIGLNGADEH